MLSDNLFRDEKGRIRSLNKVSPEQQRKIYEGEKPENIKNPPVEKIIKTEMIRTEKNKIEKKQVIEYVLENGKKVDEFAYNRFLRDKINDNPEFIINRTFNNKFDILTEINNAFVKDVPIIYKGKQITPSNYVNVTSGIRDMINNGKESGKYPIFSVNEYDTYIEVEYEGTIDPEGNEDI